MPNIECTTCGRDFLKCECAPLGVAPIDPPFNPLITQQAYDRAMAHNAMLREVLGELAKAYWRNTVAKAHEALNTTEADATAWLKQRDAKWLSNQETAVQLWSNAEQQLTTVTQERDALRRAAKRLINANNIKRLEGKTRRYKKCCRNGWLTMRKALAQKADA